MLEGSLHLLHGLWSTGVAAGWLAGAAAAAAAGGCDSAPLELCGRSGSTYEVLNVRVIGRGEALISCRMQDTC